MQRHCVEPAAPKAAVSGQGLAGENQLGGLKEQKAGYADRVKGIR